MSNNEHKLELGHKPNTDEVEIFAKSIISAGEMKMERDIKEYWTTDNEEEKNKHLIGVAMSYTLAKVGNMLNKFVKEGVLEDPNWEMDEIIAKVKQEKVNSKEEQEWKKKEKSYQIVNMSDDDVENAFNICDEAVKETCHKLKDKFGGRNSVTLMAGYCETFLHTYKLRKELMDKIENEYEFADEDEIDTSKMEKVDIKDAIKEMRSEGFGDAADALEKMADGDGNMEVKVFKVKKEN